MNTKNTLLVIATLLIGIFVGMFISGRMTKQRIQKLRQRTEQPKMIADDVVNRLDIPEDKKDEVGQIITTHFDDMKTLRHQLRDSSKSLRRHMFQELKATLSPEEFQELRKQFRSAKKQQQRKKGRKKRRSGNES